MCTDSEWACENGQCIPNENVGDSIVHCQDKSDEGLSDEQCRLTYPTFMEGEGCPNDYACRSEGSNAICINSSSICDGHMDCPFNDDEVNCHRTQCPDGCTYDDRSFKCNFTSNVLSSLPKKVRNLDFSSSIVSLTEFQRKYLPLLVHLNLSHSGLDRLSETETLAVSLGCENLQTLDLSFNKIRLLPSRAFQRMFRLRRLNLEGNPVQLIKDFAFSDLAFMRRLSIPSAYIERLSKYALHGFENLVFLNMSENKIFQMDDNVFMSTPNLELMDLSHNQLEYIGDHFLSLVHLEFLDLSFNKITFVKEYSFHRLIRLAELRLQGNELASIGYGLLSNVLSMRKLNISMNRIQSVGYNSFKGHFRMESLDIRNNKISVYQEIFRGLVNLRFLYVDSYTICCAKPDSVKSENCFSPQDKISSCQFLIREGFLGVGIWFLSFLSIIGNMAVFIVRMRHERWKTIRSYTIFVLNLSVSDLLMGIYLFIIAYKDSEFRGVYGYEDKAWRNNDLCSLAGILATVSSESSAMFIFLITFDRVLGIKFTFSPLRFTRRSALICSMIVWGVSILISVIPTMFWEYFQGQFYSVSGVCISLPLTKDTQYGYGYSVFIFICFNFVLFCGICVGQIVIFREIKQVRGRVLGSSSTSSNEAAVAKSLFAVVMTDVLCWLPIAILGEHRYRFNQAVISKAVHIIFYRQYYSCSVLL